MGQTYSVAMIGCGHRGRCHAPALKADKRIRVKALCDIRLEAAEKVDTRYEFNAALYEDYTEMLEKEKPDIAVICLWPQYRLNIIKTCVDAGIKAVHCEKPMAPTWQECREIAELAENSGIQLTFSHQRRFAEGNLLVRKMIADGLFGEIKRFDLYSPRHTLDCGTHTFDQAFSFNNESPVKWIMGACDLKEPFSYFGVKAESMAVGTLVYENGVRANIQIGGPDMDIWGGVRVIGTKGFIEVFWDGNFGNGVIYGNPSWKPPVVEAQGEAQMIGVIRNIVDSFENGTEPEITYKKALRACETIYSFYESVRTHTRIELPLSGVDDNPIISMLERER